MGKYSLENYEQYPTVRCRPAEKREPAPGAGISTFQTVTVRLGEAEPALTARTLLELHIAAEAISGIAAAESALRLFASRLYRHPLVLGVTVRCDADAAVCRRLWEAAAEAFAPKRYYVPAHDGAQLDYALRRGFARGLYIRVGCDVLDTCEAMAQNGAQKLYRQMPVLVSVPEGAQQLAAYVLGWHAAAVEGIQTAAGWQLALRRVTFPKALSSGGFSPMRFWWTNRGPSYCHEQTEVRLRLSKDGQTAPIPLGDRSHCIPLADRAYNEIVRLPQVEPGVYALEFGLFLADGTPLTLAHDAPTADGYYYACDIALDAVPRPELEHIWDRYAPDGYYPLEDPKEPV